uniref:Laminin subunit beta 2 n=1 Tax=Otus sunia TaxID=257818 RepID=A0A8C8ALH0_9STRI
MLPAGRRRCRLSTRPARSEGSRGALTSAGQGPQLPMELLVLTLLLAGVPAVRGWQEPDSSHGCARGSCYPATGNLLVGRAPRLSATSTCGLDGPQEYCIVSHLQDSEKCFTCDSRDPSLPESHRIENVIYLSGPHGQRTWWQSENGVEHVSIRLDLEGEFHFTHLIMKFKTFRPAAMLVERSADFGRSWKVYRYFAYNCSKLFPGVPSQPSGLVDEVLCDQRYSEIEPSSHGEVIFKVLDPSIPVADPYSPDIQDLLRVTNLRVNLTKLHTLGDNLLDTRREVLHKYYYAVDELVLRGSCFCHGHAAHCAPAPGAPTSSVPGMVHGRCVCEHHTQGLNCERCEDFYHDLPWRPAEGSSTNACRRCDCNEHSRRCHFDMAVFLATGNASGAVCDGCQHNTMGRRCHLCKPFYYRHPRSDIRAPTACAPCDCDPAGSLDGGACDGHTDVALGMIAGQCRCKENVAGARCDRCRHGAFGLSHDDPQGCQPCRCDPRGTVTGSSPCDPVSGDCYCKRFVAGRSCSQCVPEFWGLSYDVGGCRPCACDFGGAYNNRCSMEDGACPCRPHLMGRQCDQVQPGFFCAPLDYYTYEAEQATGHSHGHPQLPPDVEEVVRDGAGRMVTWTGSGFARVRDGAGLTFRVDNVPYPMDYELLLRYEPESAEDWEAVVGVSSRALPTSPRCGNLLPSEQMYRESLPHGQRYVLLSRPFCFEPSTPYEVTMRLQRAGVTQRHPSAFILIDSLVLLPRYSSLEMFIAGDPSSVERRETFERYRCTQPFHTAGPSPVAEPCSSLLHSLSAILHDGALPCLCDPQGSLSAECQPQGGQCRCKPNVVGRRCHRCSPGTFGFGPGGCRACQCSSEGSVSTVCDSATGQCSCRQGAHGPRCDRCQPGYWGFPACRPCQCNGHAEDCDPRTGSCLRCRDHTDGERCQRCADGHFGNPALGSGQHCRPCPCPEGPGSPRHFAASCYQDSRSRQVVCHCSPGYTGPRCDECAPGYYGDPLQPGGRCLPCQCHDNIDMTDPEACDRRTGRCLRCLYNTAGPHCAECQPGYYGDATRHSCRRCSCNTLGTDASTCGPQQCQCDGRSGQCHCLPHVEGQSCDRCSPNFWNLGSGQGCQPCACHPQHALTPACNQFTGQCSCRPGFGGRTCADCQEDHWGDPRQQCRVCDCDPRGVASAQCHRGSGHCDCRPGISGVRCDQCARGFAGAFPACQPCHPCFGDWDRVVQDLAARTRALAQRASLLQHTGAAGAFEGTFRRLEESLATVRDVVATRNATAATAAHLTHATEGLRRQIEEATERLTRLEGKLTATQDANFNASHMLSAVDRSARALNHSLQDLEQRLHTLKTSNFLGAYDSIRQSHGESWEAERRADAATRAVPSPVSASAATRRRTEQLLANRRDDFNRQNAASRRALMDLAERARALSLHPLNEKVCGVAGDVPCAESPCGGAGCRDEDGGRRCGGLSCGGAVSTADSALDRARHAQEELRRAAGDVAQLSHKVAEAKGKADEARLRAQAALDRANQTRARVESSNKELRELISHIKAFLSQEGADPESIEVVASRVLELSLPATPAQIHRLAEEIKARVRSLASVDAILEQTAGDVRQTGQLLQDAQRARSRAEGVRGTAEAVRQALEEARRAQGMAEQALQRAAGDIQHSERALGMMQAQTVSAEQQLAGAMGRIGLLDGQTDALKVKRANNSLAATRAQEAAGAARDRASEAKQVLEGPLRDRYRTAQELVQHRAQGAQQAGSRAQQLRDEAAGLLRDTQGKLQRLRALEEAYERNERVLDAKAAQLGGLEARMREVLATINQQVQIYNTCQ